MRAEYIEFNGEWHKTCSRCKKHFGSDSKEGLTKFFYTDTSRSDGVAHRCRVCENKRNRKGGHSSVKKTKFPLKHFAHTKLNNAIALGKIKKKPCRDCGSLKVHGHHTDYTKPLKVIWLCPKHHRQEHRNNEKQ